MHRLLASEYSIQVKERATLFNQEAFLDESFVYFIMSSQDKEVTYMEQAALAYFLHENNYHVLAHPIRNKQGDWFTTHDQDQLMVIRVEHHNEQQRMSDGYKLASFHQIGSTYSFEPQTLSSYGQWKDLWIEKLTMVETSIQQKNEEESHPYYRLVMDILPYIIGICENAIQYIAESEVDLRFNSIDQGSITFHRYNNHLQEPIIWFHDLVFDHPTRDIAEYIRYQFLINQNRGSSDITSFLEDYQQVRPLSIFSWRQLYGRLIYPAHFFDCLETVLLNGLEEKSYAELERLINVQTDYEKRLRDLFDLAGVGNYELEIPTLSWL